MNRGAQTTHAARGYQTITRYIDRDRTMATIVGEKFVNRKADCWIPPRLIIARVHRIVIRVVGHQRRVKED